MEPEVVEDLAGELLPWHISERWQEYEGEARANFFRVVAICAFYLVELSNYRGLDLGFIQLPKVESVNQPFHNAITALCVAWIMLVWGVSICLRRRIFPASLKFVTSGCDVVLLTAMLLIADGPKSPLLVGYFLLINLASLRLNLPLVRFVTGASMGGYLILLGQARWYREALRVPRYHQVLFLLALALAGTFTGQAIRRMRSLAEDYAARVPRGDAGGA